MSIQEGTILIMTFTKNIGDFQKLSSLLSKLTVESNKRNEITSQVHLNNINYSYNL